MCSAQITKDRIKQLCKEKKVNIETMLTDCGLGVNAVRQINDTKGMASFNLARIADYLGCSVDYLLGRETAAAPVQQTTERGACVRPNAERSEFVRQGEERLERLVHCWDELNPTGQGKVLDYANDLRNNDKYKKYSTSLGADELMVG